MYSNKDKKLNNHNFKKNKLINYHKKNYKRKMTIRKL